MTSNPWMAHRTAVALRRSRNPVLLGAATGFVSALVPSGFAIYPPGAGAGIFGGLGAACVGCAALATVVLSFLVSSSVGGEDDDKITVAHFLSGVKAVRYRGGACTAALVQWAVLVLAASAAGAVTGLGDGLRTKHPIGDVGAMFAPVLLLILVSAYTAIIAAGISVNANGRLRSFVGNFGVLALFFILLAFGTASPTAQVARLLPAAPLWNLLPTEVTGRFTLSVSWLESVVVACLWMLAGIGGFVLCVRRGGLAPGG